MRACFVRKDADIADVLVECLEQAGTGGKGFLEAPGLKQNQVEVFEHTDKCHFSLNRGRSAYFETPSGR